MSKKLLLIVSIPIVLVLGAATATHGFYTGWLVQNDPAVQELEAQQTQLQSELATLESTQSELNSEISTLETSEPTISVDPDQIATLEDKVTDFEAQLATARTTEYQKKVAYNDLVAMEAVLARGPEAVARYASNYPQLNNPSQIPSLKATANSEYQAAQQATATLETQLSQAQQELENLDNPELLLQLAQEQQAIRVASLSAEKATIDQQLLEIKQQLDTTNQEINQNMHWTQKIQSQLRSPLN